MQQQSAIHLTPERPTTFGLLAGWGRLPLLVAEALRDEGYRVACCGVRDHADPALQDICDAYTWVGLTGYGKAVRFFRRQGAHLATMVGKIWKIRLYEPWFWFRYVPDLGGIRLSWRVLRRADRKDDTLLGTIVAEFARDGIQFVPATDYAPELLVKQGKLTRRGPSAREQRDIEFGWQMAREMGRLDIGQSVTVKDGSVLAVEAIEGTDACIQRTRQLCPRGGFTVVKVAKPQQDMRFDVPTVGIQTLETMVAAGASTLAIEAGRTIILDEEKLRQFADRHHLTVVALAHAQQARAVA